MQAVTDPCLRRVSDHFDMDTRPLVDMLLRYAGVAKRTPPERIALAVSEELADQVQRARAELEALPADPLRADALAALSGDGAVPRGCLAGLASMAGDSPLGAALRRQVARHEDFEARVGWLLEGTPADLLPTLDPMMDSDRIFHAMSSAFRAEIQVFDVLTINRIAQSDIVSLFFRSTRKSELQPTERYYDTQNLFANYFEWGEDSLRGRQALQRIKDIHGRYYIPNDGMKYVLLDAVFTWLDAADRFGHRPLSEAERMGYFHAYIRLGMQMEIADVDHDHERMLAWFRAFNEANAGFSELKRDTFDRLVRNSASQGPPGFVEALLLACRVGMDDTYRSALGYATPTDDEVFRVRAVFFTVGSMLERLPPQTFIRSLQNNAARREYARPEELGSEERSPYMPAAVPGAPNGGFPSGQCPVTGTHDVAPMALPDIPWAEIQRHAGADSLWIVLDGEVYDCTSFAERHPGSRDVLLRWAGKDATAAFKAAPHSAATQVFKLNFRVGRVAD